jgi:hypothetical protein
VLVVGAGLAGLACARSLADAGVAVTLVDKAGSAGGRLASRAVGSALVDHGAPFVEARTASFGRVLDRLTEEGSAILLSRDGYPRRHAFPGGTNTLARSLAAGLTLRTGARVVGIMDTPGGHAVRLEDGATLEGTELVLTPPGPQAADLLATGGQEATRLAAQLAPVRYARCLVGLFAQPAGLAEPTHGDQEVDDPLLASLSVEGYKRGAASGSEGVVARVRPEVSEARHGEPDEVLLAAIAAAVARHLRGWAPTSAQLKRWRYARPTATLPGSYLAAAGGSLLVTGDAFGEGGAEDAFLNGLMAATALLGRGPAGQARSLQ